MRSQIASRLPKKAFSLKTWYCANKLEAGGSEHCTLWRRFGQEEKDSNKCEGKRRKFCNTGKAGEES